MAMSYDRFGNEVLEEYATLEYILLGDLRDLLEEKPDEVTCRWLRAVIDALLETLPREMELQEQNGGYMAEVLAEYPNWYEQVDQLQREKQRIFVKLRHLRARIAEQISFDAIAGEIRSDLREWMAALVAHQRHERRIVQSAFNLDVGTGD